MQFYYKMRNYWDWPSSKANIHVLDSGFKLIAVIPDSYPGNVYPTTEQLAAIKNELAKLGHSKYKLNQVM